MPGESPFCHPREWPVVRLGDIAIKIGSGATPLGGEDSYLASRERFALVRSQNVLDRRFDSTGLAFISHAQAEGLRNAVLQERDLLLNITGDGVTFSRCCAVPKEVLPACVNQHVAIIRVDLRRADPGYILSYLTHPAVKSYIESFNAGGSRRAITKGHIESFELPLPPLEEQRAIACILGTLDDKIELNRQMNETLEEMARAIFKSWFVDFDPVRAKFEGRDSGLPKHIADLFPDRFENSELGEIPAGWAVWRVADAGNVICGKTPSTIAPEYYGEDIPFITIPDMHGKIFAINVARKLSLLGAESQKNKMLPAGTICVSCIATPGLVVITSECSQTNQQINSIVPSSTDETYFWYWVFRGLGDDIRAGGSGGSVLTNLSTGRFSELPVLAP
jgi:type I restriction enzyme S subunit